MIPENRHRAAKSAIALGVTLVLLLGSVQAQDLDPRRYINLPVSQNFMRLGLGRSTGDVNVSPSLPLEDGELSINAVSLAYMRTLAVGGKASMLDVYVPYACASGSAIINDEAAYRDVCGWGDATIRFTHNFVGAPALEMSEFIKKERELVVGASIQVSMPTGRYDPDYLLNIGANRWVIRPEIGVSVPWRNWTFDFAASVRIFSDNSDYVGDTTLRQDPLYNLQAHAVYNLANGHWISLDTNYFFGGETYRDDVQAMIRQENSRIGVNWYILVNSKLGLRVTASTGVITRIGNDSDALSLAALYRF